MPTVSIIYFTGSGHTAKLAEAVDKGATSVTGVKTNLIAITGDDIINGRYKNDQVIVVIRGTKNNSDTWSVPAIGLSSSYTRTLIVCSILAISISGLIANHPPLVVFTNIR